MAKPEFREEVYLSDSYHANTVHEDVGGPMDAHRETMLRDTLRETPPQDLLLRDSFHREPAAREMDQDMSREAFSRETQIREPLTREPLSREPAPRLGGRLAGTPLSGNPLPGSANGTGTSTHESHAHRPVPPGRALSVNSGSAEPAPTPEEASAMQRAMGLLKQAAPFVARLLPLIEGNVAGAVTNLLAQRPHPPAEPVDLTPVHNQLAEIQMQHIGLRTSVQEQTTTLKRVEDQLEMVREATDRNTLEQQELIEDLKSMGSKVSRIALGVTVLLLISIGINLWLYLYIKRVLP
ncbi:MAG TPA: hypothetical protein VGL22_14300 [Terracidiphilus sp.]|jgi:hypothetical protein